MVTKLQFAVNMNQKFVFKQEESVKKSVETIVNFICENMASCQNSGSMMLIPVFVRDKLTNSLLVRDSKLNRIKLR